MSSKTLAIIVAAGSGWRLSGMQSTDNANRGTPKQYMLLSERCVLDHTITCFTRHPDIDHVMVVIHREDEVTYQQMISGHEKLLPVVIGGNTRQQSVCFGLQAADIAGFNGKVLIHDGVRPFVSDQTISLIIEKTSSRNCALPAHQATDTLKKADSDLTVTQTIDRKDVFCAQTPQGFLLKEILDIHENAAWGRDKNLSSADFTDDASMFEAVDYTVNIVDSPASNFKITTAEDLEKARQMIDEKVEESNSLPVNHHTDIRTGNGYDVHALIEGDEIILCGHKIPFNQRLEGHSDADVALHALTDAMLGTIGAGDIGAHFPPSDPQWENADSEFFLKTALELVRSQNGVINNIDITIICEAPKVGPHRQAMRKKLSQICDLAINRVSVKATTNEKLGFLGRGEGIAAIATTTISFGTRT